MRLIFIATLVVAAAVVAYPPHTVLFSSTMGDLFGNPPQQLTMYAWLGGEPETGYVDRLGSKGSGRVISAEVDAGHLLARVLIVLAVGGVVAALVHGTTGRREDACRA